MLLKNYRTSRERKEKILEAVTDYAERCTDTTTNIGRLLRLEENENFELHVEPVDISTHAEGQLLSRLRIPASYLHRCPNGLQAVNINYWIGQNDGKELLFRYIDNRVRAIFSSRYSPIDDNFLIPEVLDALQAESKDENLENIHLRTFDKTDDFTMLRVLYKDLQVEQDGQIYWAGVNIINSETGMSAIWIKPTIRGGTSNACYDYLDKLATGATRFVHVGDIEIDAIRQAVREAKEAAEVGIAKILEASALIVDDPANEARNLIQEADFLPNRIISVIEEQYEDQETASKLHVAQSILEAVKDLPTFQKYLAECEVGRYLDLFRDTRARLAAVIQDIG